MRLAPALCVLRGGALWGLLGSSLACVPTRVLSLEPAKAGTPDGGPVVVNGQSHTLAECYSGDRERFLGVDLLSAEGDLILRVAMDPIEGPRLKLVRRGAEGSSTTLFSAKDCTELEADVRPTHFIVNTIRDVEGEVRARCGGEGGVSLVATVRFAHCH